MLHSHLFLGGTRRRDVRPGLAIRKQEAMGEGSYGCRVIQLSPQHSLVCSEIVVARQLAIHVREPKRAQGQAWISKAGYALPLALSTSPMIPINLEGFCLFATGGPWQGLKHI